MALSSCGSTPAPKNEEVPETTVDDGIPKEHTFPTFLSTDSLRCLEQLYSYLNNACYWVGPEDSIRLHRLNEIFSDPESFGLRADHLVDVNHARSAVEAQLEDNEDQDVLVEELGYSLVFARLMYSTRYGEAAPDTDLLSFCHDTAFVFVIAEAIRSDDPYNGLIQALPKDIGDRIVWIREYLQKEDLGYTGYDVPAYKEDSAACVNAALIALKDLGLLTQIDSLIDSTAFYTALKSFQVQNGLDADGVIGKLTVKAFAKPNTERYGQLLSNLERARQQIDWEKAEVYIEVNVPEMALRLYKDGEVISTHKVVVGKRKEHKTPSFKASINEMVVNPEWVVPYSISTKEILPDQQVDSNYLVNHNYKVYDIDKNLVDPYSIDWSELSIHHFPYRIVQKAGPYNALGTVKFMFPNKYMVYIHDTPSKSLFYKTQRDFSHGCIRVQDPYRLALLILENSRTKIDSAAFYLLLDTSHIHSIPIYPRIPVIVNYASVRKDEKEDYLIFYDDIYRRDEEWINSIKNQ